jgi:outer membrane protein insertion porin family
MFFLQVFIISAIFAFNSMAGYTIEVQGNKTIEAKTVQAYSGLENNEHITNKDLSNAVKAIYKTGFFNNVKIEQEGSVINIQVTETPIVKKIAFNGSKAIGKDKMLEELLTKEKRFFSKTEIQNDTKRLTLIYQKLGFLNAKIRPMAEIDDVNAQVTVIFDIKEGKKAQIDTISIEGNKHFSDKTIKEEALKIRERTIFKLNLGASFDAERIQNEAVNIKKFYMLNGFPLALNNNTVSKYDSAKFLFDVVYFIEEGGKI